MLINEYIIWAAIRPTVDRPVVRPTVFHAVGRSRGAHLWLFFYEKKMFINWLYCKTFQQQDNTWEKCEHQYKIKFIRKLMCHKHSTELRVDNIGYREWIRQLCEDSRVDNFIIIGLLKMIFFVYIKKYMFIF